MTIAGMPVIVSDHLPLHPTPAERARRIVRHGLTDWLSWLGEDAGPRPGDLSHAFVVSGSLVVSPDLSRQLIRPQSRQGAV